CRQSAGRTRQARTAGTTARRASHTNRESATYHLSPTDISRTNSLTNARTVTLGIDSVNRNSRLFAAVLIRDPNRRFGFDNSRRWAGRKRARRPPGPFAPR